VRMRLRQMRDNAAVLAAAASLSAGCSDQHAAGGLPLPAGTGAAGTAAGSGGAGSAGSAGKAGSAGSAGKPGAGAGGRSGIGGVAGYAVVDPLPQPFQCSAPPFMDTNTSANWESMKALLISSSARAGGSGSPFLQSVRSDHYNITATVNASSYPPSARLTLVSGSWPQLTVVFLSFMCSLPGGGYSTYELTLQLDTSKPAAMGTVPIMLGRGEDAGI